MLTPSASNLILGAVLLASCASAAPVDGRQLGALSNVAGGIPGLDGLMRRELTGWTGLGAEGEIVLTVITVASCC